jgi:hypothetical protein
MNASRLLAVDKENSAPWICYRDQSGPAVPPLEPATDDSKIISGRSMITGTITPAAGSSKT